jgi:hypothetical protein
MKIHSSSLSIQTNTPNQRSAPKNSAVQDVGLVDKLNSQNQPSNQHPSSANEIKKILSTITLPLKASTSEGLDPRTSKALRAYQLESNSSATNQRISAITGIDVYV